MKITPIQNYKFKVKPKMRYETLGDYIKKGKGIEIQVYEGMSILERKAVAIHELVEQTLLELKGITPAMVDRWDTEDTGGKYDPNMYNKNKFYKEADNIALYVERKIIEWAGKEWTTYDEDIMNMNIKYAKKTTTK